MQPFIRMREISATRHELVETKGARAPRERSFLVGERRLQRRSQQMGQAKRWLAFALYDLDHVHVR
ncbi:MAG: hypothetical protein P0119_02535 [Nitrospira sp.]|nr:hypothetical protein [Nitrospira sp.]